MYDPECGLDSLMMSWGHDEYMYRVLVHNKARLPPQALKMIRYELNIIFQPYINQRH